MMLAQGLGEYGALSGGRALSGLDSVVGVIEDAVRDAEPSTWFAVFIGAFLVWFVFLRAR